MLGYGVGAKFCHLTQNRPAAPLGGAVDPAAGATVGNPGQRLQTGPHGVRVGVIGVVDHRYPVRAGGHLHPMPRHRTRGAKRGCHLIEGGAAFQPDGGRTQRVGDLVVAGDAQLDLSRSIAAVHGELRPGQLVQRHRPGPHVCGAASPTDTNHPRRGHLGHRRHHGVVGIEDDHAGLRNSLRQF
ncbi:hypothetical protein LAUMK191_03209 [Mycobacterium attenuatum]|uniref:Uncharacterized protein n=1 Tax=Mycobacterium attenuatum TaxID=2341086 RepID=A0A498Q1D9_9MYCO|nr:hypothetical protein LAUMK136_03245 [Mycobacterium attenuatum]VBA54875.1 hypothetical protein LAUMK191_03209 [Mycobacterium attenuatum]